MTFGGFRVGELYSRKHDLHERFGGQRQSERSEPHEHPGAEIIYVLGGELVVNLDGEDFKLGQGDSMYFDCAQLSKEWHSIRDGVVDNPT